jgi:Fungalysin metallopeptidase (M36)/Fungalysin/Thermolysin Propeptide Motif
MSSNSLFESGEVRRGRGDHPVKVEGSFELPRPRADAADVGPEERVKEFLVEHADELRLPGAEELREVHSAGTPLGRVVRFQQMHDGLPVLGTEVLVAVDQQEAHVVQIDLNRQTRLEVAAPAGDQQLTAEQAREAALGAVGNPELRSEPPAPGEAFFPADDGLHRAYVILLPTREDPPHDWRVVVDAATGEVLERRDLIKFVDGSGLVFDPNPVVTAANAALRDPDATAAACGFAGSPRATCDAEQVTRTLRDITLDAVTGNHRLAGPFCRMQNFGPPATVFPEETNQNAFTYSSGDERFEAVNVYYHIDTFQRYLQNGSQGPSITTARNSQIPCDPHEGSGPAFYSPIDKGLHFSNSGPCRPDRAEDAHVMVHEYGHAIQDNQVPGWGGVNPTTGRNEAGAMGEGYGDAMACIFFAGHNFLREVFEPWIFGDVGGLRRVDGIKVYPGSWSNQVHADGEIWSAALWNIYRAVGGDSVVPVEQNAARDAVIKSVTLSHHLLTTTASMPDAAEAVMRTNAALDNFLGRHLMAMLDSFHARGILACDPAADLEISDGTTFWNSPDLWIRNADDNGTTHQPPEFGQDNFFYARVRNVGTATARAFVVTFNVKPWAGTEFTYPGDFLPPISATCGFNLAPGASTIVKAKWPAALVPPAGTHACWLASVYTPVDTTAAGLHVWEHNNLAQKNLTVVDLVPADSVVVPVQFGSLGSGSGGRHRIEAIRPEEFPELKVRIVHRQRELLQDLTRPASEGLVPAVREPEGSRMRFVESALVEIRSGEGRTVGAVRLRLGRDSTLMLGPEPAPSVGGESLLGDMQADLVDDDGGAALDLHPGRAAGIPVTLRPRSPVTVGLKLTVPRDTEPGRTGDVHLIQRDRAGNIVGGVTVRVRVIRR